MNIISTYGYHNGTVLFTSLVFHKVVKRNLHKYIIIFMKLPTDVHNCKYPKVYKICDCEQNSIHILYGNF